MSFDQHVFISYSHIDNKPLTPEQQGWISRFHSLLETILSMRIGQPAKIWRDDKLRGNDVFSDEILNQFPRTALLVSVLTPRYLESEWCTREVYKFCEAAADTGGVTVDNRSRVFKVIKTPVETEDPLPPEVRALLGYKFYTFDEEKAPLELDPAYGEKFAQDYNRKVAKLAWDIAQILRTLVSDTVQETSAADETDTRRPIVYLAECSYERREDREQLEIELKLHGYSVLPDQRLPRDEEEYVSKVETLLGRCQLSIHLIGNSYGGVPDGPSQKSFVILQNDLAAKVSKSAGLQRIIWLPYGTSSEHSQQQAFIDSVQRDVEAQFGADVVSGSLGLLKGTIHAALQKLEQASTKTTKEVTAARQGPKLVYLVCTEKDRKQTLPLLKFLKQQGLEVRLPVFTGDASAVRRANEMLFTTCDAVILFYGSGDEAWKFHQENELRKMLGSRGGRPLLASYTYLAAPGTDEKEVMAALEEPSLINGLDGFSQAEMKAFLQAIRAS